MVSSVSAPSFELKAIASGRIFRLKDYRTRPVLLLFVDYNTARATRDIVVSLRRRYPDFDRLPIAILVDLRVVPKLLRGTAERIIESAYRGAAEEIPTGYDPADHLILLPDWNGAVFSAYGIGDVSRHIHMILIAPDGMIHISYQGPELSRKALESIDQLISVD